MRATFKFQFVFDFDEAIPMVSCDEFIVAKLAEKGIDVAIPVYSSDQPFVAIFRDKISDK